MSVFTIFCAGTAFNRHNKDELLATLDRLVQGAEVTIDWAATLNLGGAGEGAKPLRGTHLFNDGPGSVSDRPDAPTPGQANPYLGIDKKEANKLISAMEVLATAENPVDKDFFREFYGDAHGRNWAVTGKLTGAGWQDNVLKTVAVVANLEPMPTTVNMIGWSRGAVTCVKVANKMMEVFGTEVKLNLFLIDPVYGAKVSTALEDSELPPNVENAVVILSMHENRRWIFDPQDMDTLRALDPGRTRLLFLPMPGNHSHQVQNTRSYPVDGASHVTWSLAVQMLEEWGTVFDPDADDLILDQAEYARQYAIMWLHMARYEDDYFRLLPKRSFMNKLQDYVLHPECFINAHHLLSVAQGIPGLYKAVWGEGGVLDDNILEMLTRLEQDNKVIVRWLVKSGAVVVRNVNGKDRLVPARFAASLEVAAL